MKKGFIIVLVLGLILAYPIAKFSSVEVIEVTITDKERISTGSGDDLEHKFLIYTKNEVFENTDALFQMKWNSTDVQNDLKKDSTYKVKVWGWRMPFFSTYRNIISIEN